MAKTSGQISVPIGAARFMNNPMASDLLANLKRLLDLFEH